MKRHIILTSLIMLFSILIFAQDKELKDAKKQANSELKSEIKLGRNTGDRTRIRDARFAREVIRDATSAGEVNRAIIDYRNGKRRDLDERAKQSQQ